MEIDWRKLKEIHPAAEYIDLNKPAPLKMAIILQLYNILLVENYHSHLQLVLDIMVSKSMSD